MQPIIEVLSTKSATKTGTSSKTNKPYSITNQRGYFHSIDPITGEVSKVAIDLRLDDPQSPYPVGRYTIDATSYRVSQFGDLTLSRMHLDPIQPAVVSAPQAGKLATAA